MPATSMPASTPNWRGPGRSWPPRSSASAPMNPEAPARPSRLGRALRALGEADLSRRVGRVSDLIGLIIEATGVQVEIGEVCLVGGGRDRGGRGPVPTEVVGFRGGRSLLMPLGDLHGIGPGTGVHPTGSPVRGAGGGPL